VHYHFGSKEALAYAVIGRRFHPINERRVALLDELEARGEPTLEEVLTAFVGPILEMHSQEDSGFAGIFRLLMRLFAGSESFAEEHRKLFQRAAQRFVPAFRRVLPELDERTFFWRLTFTVSVLGMSMSDPKRLKLVSGGHCDPHDQGEALEQMVSFLAGGLRAPVPVSPPERTR
jgi:AcrR family transcriptional regulator